LPPLASGDSAIAREQGRPSVALRKNLQLTGSVGFLTRSPADLTACCFANPTLGNQHYGVRRQTVHSKDALAHSANYFASLRRRRLARDFLNHNKVFFNIARNRKRSAASRPEQSMGCSSGSFDILRVEIAPAHDDQVLQAPCNEKTAVSDKAQITGFQKTRIARTDAALECGICFVRSVPVPGCNGRTGHPYFADLIFPACLTFIAIDYG
jgi:hypothetical protein